MSNRPWLKIRLSQSNDVKEALKIIEVWQRTKLASVYVIGAILVYKALLNGDASVLYQHFPFLGTGAPSVAVPKKFDGPVRISRVELDDDTRLDNFMDSIGLDLEL